MDSHASHVLIRGHVFTYEEKAPFVKSGVSVLGALEYDFQNDHVKCHECGQWFTSIGAHLSNGWGAHGDLTVAEYKKRHGINLRGSGLVAIGAREAFKRRAVTLRNQRREPFKSNLSGKEFSGKSHVASSWKERKNVNARCQAQTIFRIQVLAAELGRTPTKRELAEAGLHSLWRDFGNYSTAMEECGLVPNALAYHGRNHSPLPQGFPTKQDLLNVRMPWPKDYFGIQSAHTAPSVRFEPPLMSAPPERTADESR